MQTGYRLARKALFYLAILVTTISWAAGGSDQPSNTLPWPAVAPDEVAMKSYGRFPEARALILYRKVERNDAEGWERNYLRIKILTDEGRDLANVETGTFPSFFTISEIEARTIRSDGTIVPFTGTVFEKVVARYKNLSLFAKVLALPDVKAGSIIEYRYKLQWPRNLIWDSAWLVQRTIPTREADFTLYPHVGYYGLRWSTFFLSMEEQPHQSNQVITLKVRDVAASESEVSSPPERELLSRVEFNYFLGAPLQGDAYWKAMATQWSKGAEDYMSKTNAAREVVASVTAPGDTAEVKLKKLYVYVQKLRNLSYEHAKSSKEQKKENLKFNANVDDVLKHQYGNHHELNRTFVALARVAGYDATILRVAERDRYFLHKEVFDWDKVNWELAVVKVDGKTVYLDPGVPLCPYGMLAWEDTGAPGLLLDKDNTLWSKTPEPSAEDMVRRRTAELVLDADGTLHGSITVTLTGKDALYHRLIERENDDVQRKKDMDEMIKAWLPATTTLTLEKLDDWNASSDKFAITATVNIPAYASQTGKRMMVPMSLFAASDDHNFRASKRVHPVYLRNPHIEVDDVRIKLPAGMDVEALPEGQRFGAGDIADVKIETSHDKDVLSIKREIVIRRYLLGEELYPAIRGFYNHVKSVGEEQAILRAAKN